VVTFGRGDDGQLGHGDADERLKPTTVAAFAGAEVDVVVCGAEHSVALSKRQKQVYSWGWYACQAPHPQDPWHLAPTAYPTSRACAALSNPGLCRGDFGRLGHGDSSDVFLPQPIAFFSGMTVSKIACGDTFSLAIIDNGELYSFGRNQNGQLGLGHKEDVTVPARVHAFAVTPPRTTVASKAPMCRAMTMVPGCAIMLLSVLPVCVSAGWALAGHPYPV
jgi:alpha-tubulin suppressor-like RCC1 family protein